MRFIFSKSQACVSRNDPIRQDNLVLILKFFAKEIRCDEKFLTDLAWDVKNCVNNPRTTCEGMENSVSKEVFRNTGTDVRQDIALL